MAGWVKVTLYFINSLFLYFVIGIIACNIPFPIMGMIAGAPSVFIAAVTLAFARTLEVYMQGNCRIDLKNYLHALIDLIMIILGVTLLVAVIYAMYLCYFMIN